MKQLACTILLLGLLFAFATVALADNNCGGNSCQPLPTQAQACEGPAANRNPHCQPAPTESETPVVVTNTPVPSVEPSASPTPDATEPATEPTDEPNPSTTPTATDEQGNPVTSTPDGGTGNGGSTETDDQGASQGQIPLATDAPFIPFEDGTCSVTGEEQFLTQATIGGMDILRNEDTGWNSITPNENGINYDANVANDCVLVSLQGFDGTIMRSGLNGSNMTPIIYQGETIQAKDLDADDNYIAFRTINGDVFVSDYVGSFLWKTYEGARGNIFINARTVEINGQSTTTVEVLLQGSDGFMHIVSANGETERVVNIVPDAILGWNGNDLFYNIHNMDIAYNLVSETSRTLAKNTAIRLIEADPTGEGQAVMYTDGETVTLGLLLNNTVATRPALDLNEGWETQPEWWVADTNN